MALVYLGLSSNLIWIWMRQRRTTTTTTRSSSIINNGEAEEVQNDGIIRTTSNGGGNDAGSDIRNNILGEQQDFSNNPWDLPSTTTAEFTLFGIIKTNRPPWQYFIIAFLDVQANAATMLAFKYTTLTSVSLFDALAIPSAMVLSRCFFGRQYTWIHILGVVTSMTGVVFNVMQDYESDQAEDKNFPHKMRGDILAIAGGLMYGLTNTLTEVTVRHNNNNNNNGNNTTEYLGLMGFFGFCVAFIQSLLFEFNDILEFFGRDPDQEATCSLAMGWWLYFVFVAVNLASYMGAAHFLTISEAAYFSLSLLTGDLWSVVFSIVAEHIVPQPLFFLALIFVLSGVVLYEMAPSPVQSDNNEQQEQRRVSVPIPGHDGLFNNSSEDDEDDTQQEYNAAIL